MNNAPFASTTLDCPTSQVLRRVRRSLENLGLRALETFDLQTARQAAAHYACPQHGSAPCDCQLIVLMVYGEATAPTALMLQGTDGRTWISLPDAQACGVDALIETAIEHTIREIRGAEGL